MRFVPGSIKSTGIIIIVLVARAVSFQFAGGVARFAISPRQALKHRPKLQLPYSVATGYNKAATKLAMVSVAEDGSNEELSVLKHTQPAGSFATTGCLEPIPFPQISVQGVGKIGFPLMECAVETLKAAVSPFGKDSETTLDEKGRTDWQIEADKVTLGGGAAWEGLFETDGA
jgi:hypothetical protein